MLAMLRIVLFGALGMALAWSGVSITEKPVEFITILLIVLGIQVVSLLEGREQ